MLSDGGVTSPQGNLGTDKLRRPVGDASDGRRYPGESL